MSKHTPGPWRNLQSISGDRLIAVPSNDPRSPNHWVIGMVYMTFRDTSSSKEEAEANARLIAAAPDMLEALKDIAHGMVGTDARQLAAKIIAKAEGRE